MNEINNLFSHFHFFNDVHIISTTYVLTFRIVSKAPGVDGPVVSCQCWWALENVNVGKLRNALSNIDQSRSRIEITHTGRPSSNMNIHGGGVSRNACSDVASRSVSKHVQTCPSARDSERHVG